MPLYGKLYVAPGHRYNGSPILLWEFGGVGYVLPEDASKVPENSWGYSGVEADREAALSRHQRTLLKLSPVFRRSPASATPSFTMWSRK